MRTRRGDPARSGGAGTSARAQRFMGEADELLGAEVLAGPAVAGLLSAAADPDAAALGVLRVVEAVAREGEGDRLRAALAGSPAFLSRLILLAGASEASIDHLVRWPDSVFVLNGEGTHLIVGSEDAAPDALRRTLFTAVGADPDAELPTATMTGEEAVAALRRRYRDLLVQVTVDDLAALEPTSIVESVTALLSDLAAGVIDAGLTIARAETEDADTASLAVIGMGKCGARELNYVSDVDVVFCYAARGEAPDDTAARAATRLALRLVEIISGSAAEPALWELDAALRPEGKAGPLVRKLEEFDHYYAEVAHNWEFQALLKARPIAGDAALGAAWYDTLNPYVWTASGREGFIEQVRAMRVRVVDLIPKKETERQIKLGPGGLRDVEFSAQLLQLVHGLADDRIRVPTTLRVLAALGETGYIASADAADLAEAYRFMRVVEHRLQIPRMQRTALLPDQESKLRTLARSVYALGDRSEGRLADDRTAHSKRVRGLHEQIFYRPILEAAAGQDALTAMSAEAARARLAAFGYRGTKAAMGHIAALTSGVSRAAVVHRQVLPALLDWFSEGVDPDAGLLAFRRLSESLSGSNWYLKLLRDSGVAARSMAQVLSLSEFATGLLLHNPAAAAWLDDPERLQPRSVDSLRQEAGGLLERHGAEAVEPIRALYSREVLRTALGDVLDAVELPAIPGILSQLMEITIDAALSAVRAGLDAEADVPDYEFAVIAMGRLGGAEIGYFSDADVMFVHRPLVDDLDSEASGRLTAHVKKVALALTSALGGTGSASLEIDIDADLRPEGKSGPLVRGLESYRRYYAQWSEPWEAQALLRARPIAGSGELREAFDALIDPLRYPGEVPVSSLRQMRRLKARMESERLPRGADPKRHIKLGRGGLSDVEWTVQLLQLRHAADHPGLRTTSTLGALHAAVEAGLAGEDDARTLETAWSMATALRSAVMLFRGRTAAALPADHTELEAAARLMGYRPGSVQRLAEEYLGATRRARKVMERLFYEFD